MSMVSVNRETISWNMRNVLYQTKLLWEVVLHRCFAHVMY